MNKRILNRDGVLPADNWYQIEVPGEHLNRAAGVVQLIDEAARQSIVNCFAAMATAAGDAWSGLLIDQDHFSLDPEKSTEAFGWLMEVRNRGGELEGRIDWTDIGEPAVSKKRFKFFSTVYDKDAVEKVGERKIKNRSYPLVRPLALDRLALTNDPNNKGGKPISNREERDESQPNIMKSLLKKLGLAEDASEESGLAALQTIVNRATTAEEKLTTITAERDGLLETAIEGDLEKHKGVIKNRDSVKAKLKADRKGTLEFLESLQTPAGEGGEGDRKPITNRKEAKTPAEIKAEKDDAAENERAVKIRNRAGVIQREEKISYTAAFKKAEGEFPAAKSA